MKNNLKEIIERENVCVKDLCYIAEIDRGNLYRYERGDVIPNVHTALRIAEYLKCSVEDIWSIK